MTWIAWILLSTLILIPALIFIRFLDLERRISNIEELLKKRHGKTEKN